MTKVNAPLEICGLEPVRPLEFGQVLVKVLVSGICGSQLLEIAGLKPGPQPPLPHPMGHEGCGIVLEIGPGVKQVKVGDKVVMHWRKGAGIESDFPRYQFKDKEEGRVKREETATELHAPDGIAGGREMAPPEVVEPRIITGGRVTTFMEQAVCSENRLTTVPQDTPEELCALLGCGLSTALATLENEARLLRGESILIVGCGGLGTNLILAAKLTGACPITVTDVEPEKSRMALSIGADDFWHFDAARMIADQAAGRQPSSLPHRFDVIIETSGAPAALHATIGMLAPSGRFIMVGQPKPGARVTLENACHLFEGSGKTIKATQGGGYRPDLDCPRYARFFAQHGALPEAMVSDRFSLDDINKALDCVRNGGASRVIIYPGK